MKLSYLQLLTLVYSNEFVWVVLKISRFFVTYRLKSNFH